MTAPPKTSGLQVVSVPGGGAAATRGEAAAEPRQLARSDAHPDAPPEPLPDVYRGALDADGVRALFGDLLALPGGVEVRLKAGAEVRAQVGVVTLDRARDLLLDGMVRGVQLVYTHDGQTWFDTVMGRGDGFEVVRMGR